MRWILKRSLIEDAVVGDDGSYAVVVAWNDTKAKVAPGAPYCAAAYEGAADCASDGAVVAAARHCSTRADHHWPEVATPKEPDEEERFPAI